ncbi:MAG TPA: XRE family transcriptional regulator [Acidiferrobacteraceae bacterium]|nr:XRE family transcriptional regulator [Acidiferrobacteraceae bacterium]
MNDIQIIKKGGEPEYAIVPIDDYERMRDAAECLEDAGDIVKFQARLAGGNEELLPAEMVNRIVDGEAPLKVWREYRGFKPIDMAREVDISAGYYSELESGVKEGSLDVWRRLANGLDVALDDILPALDVD